MDLSTMSSMVLLPLGALFVVLGATRAYSGWRKRKAAGAEAPPAQTGAARHFVSAAIWIASGVVVIATTIGRS
jgi:hypothetical protein